MSENTASENTKGYNDGMGYHPIRYSCMNNRLRPIKGWLFSDYYKEFKQGQATRTNYCEYEADTAPEGIFVINQPKMSFQDPVSEYSKGHNDGIGYYNPYHTCMANPLRSVKGRWFSKYYWGFKAGQRKRAADCAYKADMVATVTNSD